MKRRNFIKTVAGTAAPAWMAAAQTVNASDGFKFKYIVGSSMFGELSLSEILPLMVEMKTEFIDIWPRKHGNQREQVEEMGHDKFAAMLKEHGVKLGCSTRYDLGPFGLQEEMKVVSILGGDLLVCGGRGPKKLKGAELKAAVKVFAEKMKPQIEAAEKNGVVIGMENHGNNIMDSADSLKWYVEFTDSKHTGIALAPYHLESLGMDSNDLAKLIEDLGDRMAMFYAWQHGMGCTKKMPKQQELMQMPGRGKLDFGPIVAALKKSQYQGYTEIFMHPTPRGIPILPTAKEVADEINRARVYLEKWV
ncbi:MAG: sugar phosphate isomerase/epimerase [Verrucomicrobiales bacterium]|nr:sugar phosphate isomerase/epimerase [Verrucomicrobiales bacterium]